MDQADVKITVKHLLPGVKLQGTGPTAAFGYASPDIWRRPNEERKTLPEQWELHKSSWRYLKSLLPFLGPPTNTLAHIWAPLLSVVLVCVLIKLADGRIAWTREDEVFALKLYKCSSFVIALLLAFRLNRTYERWWSTRTAFGGLLNGVSSVVAQVATYVDDPILIRQYQKWGMCMIYATVQLINNVPKQTDPRVELLLEPEELDLYNSTTKPGKLCAKILQALTSSADFPDKREIFISTMLGQTATHVIQVSRIKLQAMPYAMSLFCTGWTYIWLLILPLGLFPEGSWWDIGLVAVMATMMLGLEDLAIQLEDPFKYIPYEAMIATTAKDLPRIAKDVQAIKKMLQQQRSLMTDDEAAAGDASSIKPWPELPARPQKA